MSVKSLLRSLFASILILMISHSLVLAQEEEEGMIQYTPEEYELYQNAVNAAPEEREDAIIQFVEENPKSTLIQYAASSYVQLMQAYESQGQTERVLDAGKRLLKLLPEEANALYLTAVAANQLGRFEEAVQYGEKAYSANPSAGLAFFLATCFGRLKDEDKYAEYGDIYCQEPEAKQCYLIQADLMRRFAGNKQWGKAAEYAQRALKGLEAAEKPPQSSPSEWSDDLDKQRVVAYSIVGRNGWESQNWRTSLENYQKVLSLKTDPAMKAEAHYYAGMSQWKQREIDSAMKAFAKGSVQEKAPYAKHCRQYLETLYKSTHNDSLAGVEEFVERSTRQ